MDKHNVQISENSTMREALRIIENNHHKIAIVIDNNDIIKGTVTDGDVRRALLVGKKLEDNVRGIMNPHPSIALMGEDLKSYIAGLKNNMYRQIVIATPEGKLHDIVSIKDVLKGNNQPGIAVIMAGGKGQRLRPITESLPKPMIEVAGKPMLEHLIKQLCSQNLKKIIVTVNYKKEIIQSYFKDGEEFGVSIEYVQEDEPLGTAGSLSLLPKWVNESFIVLNSDLVTNIDFFALKHHHDNTNNIATVCVREYQHQVPFGVVEMDTKYNIKNIDEKPVYSAMVSTGIYALSPEALKHVPYNQYLDMPNLISKLRKDSHVGAFPIYESWYDVGRIEDLDIVRKISNV